MTEAMFAPGAISKCMASLEEIPREVARRGTDLLAARAIRQNLPSEVPAAAPEGPSLGLSKSPIEASHVIINECF
jgi:hypothetical protein